MPTPYEEGYEAGLRGADPREVPFDKLTAEWHDWNQGHRRGCEYSRWQTEHEAIHGSF